MGEDGSKSLSRRGTKWKVFRGNTGKFFSDLPVPRAAPAPVWATLTFEMQPVGRGGACLGVSLMGRPPTGSVVLLWFYRNVFESAC